MISKELIQEHSRLQPVYKILKQHHTEFLKPFGVVLPQNRPTKRFLTLTHLYEAYKQVVSKTELTNYIRKFFPGTIDVQDGRHLSKQKGWYILKGGEGGLRSGEYKLVDIKTPYPGYLPDRKVGLPVGSFEELKKEYKYMCATCGNIEGKPARYFPTQIVELQQGHMDPRKELENNCIPQCEECNRAFKDKWVFDARGRPVEQNPDSSFWSSK